ncbi:MAG: rhodanese-related sulfurtransferase [Polaribacter sp.]|jgi:rhodanese-related sulfurtransferase
MFTDFLSENILWVGGFIVLANLLAFSFLQGRVKGVGSVSALELPRLQRSGNYTIVDINGSDTFAASHIPQAVNFPMASLKEDNADLVKLKGKTTIIVCQTGSKSTKAAKLLLALGFDDLHVLRGGLMGWTKENLPVTSS